MLLWHPDVHRAYGEVLFYFLLRSRFYGEDYRRSIHDLLEQVAPHAWVTFETLGFYDLLIRAWMSSDGYNTFSSQIGGFPETLRFQEIRCTSARYLWSKQYRAKPRLEPGEILSFGTEILKTAQASPKHLDVRANLAKAGLVLPDEVDRDRLSRFYTQVNFLADTEPELTAEVENMLLSSAEVRRIVNVSLYACSGNSAVMLKGAAHDLDELHQFLMDLRKSAIFGPRIRTETILAGRPSATQEWDYINFAAAQTPQELQFSFAQLVGLPIPAEGQPTAEDVLESFRLVRPNLPTDYDGYFKRAFRGWIQGGSVDLKSSALPILEIEGLLQSFFKRIMGKVFGGEWVKTSLPQVAEKAKVPTKNFKEFTFSDYVCCLGGLKEIEGIDLTLELGPDWEQQLRALIAIRNRCAHSLEEEVGEVPRLFRDLNTAVPMYYKLRAALHRMERNA